MAPYQLVIVEDEATPERVELVEHESDAWARYLWLTSAADGPTWVRLDAPCGRSIAWFARPLWEATS